MSNPHVSSYDQAFIDAFDTRIKGMPQDVSAMVEEMLDKFHADVLTSLQYYIVDDMKSNLDAEIREHAAKVAESMLANALAGDSQEIRNLFGFNDWYMKHGYIGQGRRPTQWALIDAIVARRPDLFVDERIAQRDVEIQQLNQEVLRLGQRLDYMKDNYVRADGDAP